MTNEQQTTFGDIVGLDPIVPTRKHYDDLVECSDGNMIAHGEVCYDYNGCAHSTDEDRHDADVVIVSDFLDGVAEWSCQYATSNADYAYGYAHMIDEGCYNWWNRVKEWFSDNFEDYYGHSKYDDYKDQLIYATDVT